MDAERTANHLTERDIVHIRISPGNLNLARRQVQMMPQGRQVFEKEGQDRVENDVVGQVCTIAWHLYQFGHVHNYLSDRWHQNRMPWKGDGGHDVGAVNVDIKGSMVRTERPLLKHTLAIRPCDLHDGWVYVLALCDPSFGHVDLIGWARRDDLPSVPASNGIFAGAHVLPAEILHALPPLYFNWLEDNAERRASCTA